MNRKVFSTLAIVTALTIASPLKSFASEDVEKYVPKIKQAFDIGDEYENFDVFTNNFDGKTTYNLSWMNNHDNVDVRLDANGNIIGYSKYDSSFREEHSKFPKITKEEALKKAKSIIQKLDPNLFQNLKYSEETQMFGDLNSHNFRFIRLENDLPFEYNSVHVAIDSSTGELDSLHIEWDKDLKVPNKNDIISEEKASELYKENQDAELIYNLNNKDNKLDGKLLYTIKNKDISIDAKSGKNVSDIYGMNSFIYHGFLFGNMEKVSTEDEKTILNSKKIVSKLEAEKALRDFAALDKSYSMPSSRLMKSNLDDKYIWEIEILKEEGNSSYGTTVAVDAKTKEVLSLSTFDFTDNEPSKYNKAESLEKAVKFLKEKMPEKYKQVEHTDTTFYDNNNDIKSYSFTFERIVDGVKMPQNGFSLSISAVTGEVTNYNYTWNDIKIPSKDKAMAKDKAKDTLLNDKKLELKYIIDKDSVENKKKEVKLVYGLKEKDNVFIDATTGEKVNLEDFYDVYNINDRNKEYNDIDKSFAKTQINKLKENGIFLPGESFNPKEDISQKDFLYLLTNTKGYIEPYENEYLYRTLSDEGVIKVGEKKPDKAITRGEAVKYIIRSFGMEKSANLKDIYKSNYTDINSISKDLKGYVALAEGLGIVSGKGNFRANDNLTREEAAVLIYNILNRD